MRGFIWKLTVCKHFNPWALIMGLIDEVFIQFHVCWQEMKLLITILYEHCWHEMKLLITILYEHKYDCASSIIIDTYPYAHKFRGLTFLV